MLYQRKIHFISFQTVQVNNCKFKQNSSKKLKVSANPLGLLAENRSNKKA